jgi:hypothetical protein
MSVIFYEAKELGNVAAAAVGGSMASTDGKAAVQRWSEVLAEVSAANAKAFAHTYSDLAEPATAEEILRAATDPRNYMIYKTAVRTLQGLAYNCMANDGTDFLTGDVSRNMVSLMTHFLRD